MAFARGGPAPIFMSAILVDLRKAGEWEFSLSPDLPVQWLGTEKSWSFCWDYQVRALPCTQAISGIGAIGSVPHHLLIILQ